MHAGWKVRWASMVTTSHSQSLATTHENKIMTKGETKRKTGKQVFETIILFEKVYFST